jgi:two-component system LytT family response regulator
MSTIRTVVVDDEKPARVRLTELLQREPDVEMVGTASDGREALDLLRRVKPDLLFLDVQMPELDGLGVLRQLTPDEFPSRSWSPHTTSTRFKPSTRTLSTTS